MIMLMVCLFVRRLYLLQQICFAIEKIVYEGAERLKSGGLLLFEMSPMIAERCLKLVNDSGLYSSVKIEMDLARLPRVVTAIRK